jgi:hypothetical protein
MTPEEWNPKLNFQVTDKMTSTVTKIHLAVKAAKCHIAKIIRKQRQRKLKFKFRLLKRTIREYFRML